MAEEKPEKELDLEADENESSEEETGSNKKRLFMIIGAVVLLAGGAAAYFFLLGGDDEAAEVVEVEEEVIPQEQAEYLELDPPFVISLPARGRQRFLQANITVMSRSRAAILKVEEHMPAVRHHLSNILSAQSLESLQSAGGIELVRTEATEQINQLLLDEYGGEAIEEILFTSFVMQ